ncbi:MAG: TIGR01777 family oxidoreductase [Pirellulales bacterium]
MPEFRLRSLMPCSSDELFAWHMRLGAFERLAPPWERVEVEKWAEPHQVGERAVIRTRLAPLVWKRWIAEYREFEPGKMFRDVQISGPFARFDHRHRMSPATEHDAARQSWLEDYIEYAPPLGWLGQAVAGGWVRTSLARMFAYRHRTTADDLAAHARAGGKPMRILLTGAGGLVGSALRPFLTAGGHSVVRLYRPGASAKSDGITLADLEASALGGKDASAAASEPFDAVVHLAGEGIAEGRWTAERKRRIRESRVEGTTRLCQLLARLPTPPRVLVNASAIGYYGDRADESLDETSSPGDDFLAQVCRDWEAAAAPAQSAGIRTAFVRFGVILSARGGALTRMLPPFRMGAGGRVGSGRQYMSWVALDDVLGAIHHVITNDSLAGPVNVVSPAPVTNAEFTRTLGHVLRRPTFFPLPALAARAAFGELADALLLASQKVAPTRLLATGYPFRYPDLETALRFQLGAMRVT